VLFCAINTFLAFKKIGDFLDDDFPTIKLFGIKDVLICCIPILNVIVGVASGITLLVNDEEYKMAMEKIIEEYEKRVN
jgi:hypothetical protein